MLMMLTFASFCRGMSALLPGEEAGRFAQGACVSKIHLSIDFLLPPDVSRALEGKKKIKALDGQLGMHASYWLKMSWLTAKKLA